MGEDWAKPRQYSLVQFRFCNVPTKDHCKYPFTKKGMYIFLGEIPNMEGHCVVIEFQRGEIYSGYHTENFQEFVDESIEG